jgi:hypothetical protein
VFLPDNFGRFTSSPITNLFFANAVSLTPGTTYYFEVTTLAGSDAFGILAYNTFHYAGGIMYQFGQPTPASDLWFREGIIVPAPEPGTLGLGLLGAGIFYFARRRGRKPS